MRGYPSYRRPSNRARRATTLVGAGTVLLMLFLLSREAGFVAWGLEPVGPSIAQPLMPRGPELQTTPVSAEVSPLRPAQEIWTEPDRALKLTPRLSTPKGTPTIVEPRFKPIDLPALAEPVEDPIEPKETAILSACDAGDCNDEIRDDEDRLSAAVAEVIEDGDGKGDDDPPGDVDDHGDDDGGGYSGGGGGDGDCDRDRDDVAENEHDDGHDSDDDHHGHHGDGDGDDDDDDDDSSNSGSSGGGHHHS